MTSCCSWAGRIQYKRRKIHQVFSFATYTEAIFEENLETAVTFINWRFGRLFYKLLEIIPFKTTIRPLNNMLSDRLFRVIMGNIQHSLNSLNDGLPQESMLASVLFSLCIADVLAIRGRKFSYVDDWTIATRENVNENTEETHQKILESWESISSNQKLKPKRNNTEVSHFSLNNNVANRKFQLYADKPLLKHNISLK